MSEVNVDSHALLEIVRKMRCAEQNLQTLQRTNTVKYQQLGADWNDRKYQELGGILKTCSKSLENLEKRLLQSEKILLQLAKYLHEYEGNTLHTAMPVSASHTRHLSADGVAERWQTAQTNADEMIVRYRDALHTRGIPDGALLDDFLARHRAQMLNHEVQTLEVARGDCREVDENATYYDAGAVAGYDQLAQEYWKFCLDDMKCWVKDINPNYHSPFLPNNPYRVNCGSCAFAVESRMNGAEEPVASSQNIGKDEGMEQATGKKCVYMPLEDIEAHLRQQGAGSHLIVGINRHRTPFGRRQSGHWFNAYYDGEQIHTIDGQSGQILEWPYDYGDISEWCALV